MLFTLSFNAVHPLLIVYEYYSCTNAVKVNIRVFICDFYLVDGFAADAQQLPASWMNVSSCQYVYVEYATTALVVGSIVG